MHFYWLVLRCIFAIIWKVSGNDIEVGKEHLSRDM